MLAQMRPGLQLQVGCVARGGINLWELAQAGVTRRRVLMRAPASAHRPERASPAPSCARKTAGGRAAGRSRSRRQARRGCGCAPPGPAPRGRRSGRGRSTRSRRCRRLPHRLRAARCLRLMRRPARWPPRRRAGGGARAGQQHAPRSRPHLRRPLIRKQRPASPRNLYPRYPAPRPCLRPTIWRASWPSSGPCRFARAEAWPVRT